MEDPFAMKSVMPLLWVRSIEDAVDYYRDVLGFDVEFTMNGPDGKMMHGSVRSGDVALMFGYYNNGAPPAADDKVGGGALLYFNMDEGVDAYYDKVRAAGAQVTEQITDQFWGDRNFTIKDLNGYELTFAQNVRAFDPTHDLPAATPA